MSEINSLNSAAYYSGIQNASSEVAKENTPQEPLRDVIVPEANEPEPQPPRSKCC